MAFASFNNPSEVNEPRSDGEDLSTSRALGKVFLYMGLAMLITALVAIGVGALFAGLITNWTYSFGAIEDLGSSINANSTAFTIYFASLIVSLVGILITGFAMNFIIVKGKSAWPAFILYSIFMGILMSVLLVLGVDFVTLGEAFGISAVGFGVMGLVGYFSKRDLNFLVMIGFAALIIAMLTGIVFLIVFWANPAMLNAWSIGYTILVIALILIMVAANMCNIKRIVNQGNATKDLCVYCAYVMYTQFISLFLRVLYLLLRLRRN